MIENKASEAEIELRKFDRLHSTRTAILGGVGIGILPGILISMNHPDLALATGFAEALGVGIHIRESFIERRKLVKELK